LQRNLSELPNSIYQYGTRYQGDRFTRTTDAIADYVGREYSKEMRLLVKNQEENEPKEAVMPDKEEAKLPFIMKKWYGTELKQYYFKKERYEEHKANIFVIVKGQCCWTNIVSTLLLLGIHSLNALLAHYIEVNTSYRSSLVLHTWAYKPLVVLDLVIRRK
jgi:hypothetical protein